MDRKNMNYWKALCYKWNRESIKQWRSLQITAYLLLPLLVYYVVHDLTEIALWALTEQLLKSGWSMAALKIRENAATVHGIISGAAVLAGTGVLIPAVRNEVKEPDTGILPVKEAAAGYCFLACFSFCLAIGVNLLFCRLGIAGSSDSYTYIEEAQYGVTFAAGIILYGIISPLAEEALFRGLLYNRLKRCFNLWIAIVVSALLFGVFHGNMVQLLYGMVMGIFMALVYEMFRNFAAPVLMHAIANISVYTLSYRNNFGSLGTGMAWLICGITLLAAAGSYFYMRNKLTIIHKNDKKSNNQTI